MLNECYRINSETQSDTHCNQVMKGKGGILKAAIEKQCITKGFLVRSSSEGSRHSKDLKNTIPATKNEREIKTPRSKANKS